MLIRSLILIYVEYKKSMSQISVILMIHFNQAGGKSGEVTVSYLFAPYMAGRFIEDSNQSSIFPGIISVTSFLVLQYSLRHLPNYVFQG